MTQSWEGKKWHLSQTRHQLMEQCQAVPGSISCMALGSRVRAEPFTKEVLRFKKYMCVCVCVWMNFWEKYFLALKLHLKVRGESLASMRVLCKPFQIWVATKTRWQIKCKGLSQFILFIYMCVIISNKTKNMCNVCTERLHTFDSNYSASQR